MLNRILLGILLLCSLCMFILCFSELIADAVANESVWEILSGGLFTIMWGRFACFVNEKIEETIVYDEEEEE